MSLPVTVFFERSLRLSTRSAGTYVLRLVTLVILFFMLASAGSASTRFGAPGLEMLRGIIMLNLLLVCLAVPSYLASVITEEKEAGTLGLLKMAGMDAVSILLGKSTSQLLVAVMLLAAQVPFTAVAVTLGGVTLRQVVACYLALAAFLLFAGNVALLLSVVCRHSVLATALCAVFLGAFVMGPVVAQGLLGVPLTGGWAGLLAATSPLERVGEVMQTGFAGPVVGFQVLSNLALGALCFRLAWTAFEPLTREDVVVAPPRGLPAQRTGRIPVLGAGRAWANALAWKDFHFLSGGKPGLLARFLLVALVPAVMLGFLWSPGGYMTGPDIGKTVVKASLALLLLELALIADRTFGRERKWHTLSTVMALPHSPGRIVWRKVCGSLLCTAPYLAGCVVGAFLMGPAALVQFAEALEGSAFWLYAVYTAFGILYLHLVVYMSLLLRYGALLAAAAITAAIGLVLMPFAALPLLFDLGPGSAALVMLAGIAIVMLNVQHSIAERLARTAELE
jgi:ABC-type transport system involved in multi-copper enzyme maturation permease subunit